MAKVLVVEDDRDLLYIYHTALAQAGFEVETASSGSIAQAVLQRTTPDLVILDMMMPDGNGIEVIDYIRSCPHLAQTQVVVVTANDRWEAQTEQRNVEFFLVKPVTLSDLVALSKRLTQRRPAPRP